MNMLNAVAATGSALLTKNDLVAAASSSTASEALLDRVEAVLEYSLEQAATFTKNAGGQAVVFRLNGNHVYTRAQVVALLLDIRSNRSTLTERAIA